MLRQSQESMFHAWNQSQDVGCGWIDTVESILLDSKQGQGRELKQGTWMSGSQYDFLGVFLCKSRRNTGAHACTVSSKGCGDKGVGYCVEQG